MTWLRAVETNADADALAASLHLCTGALHEFVDCATELTAEQAAASGETSLTRLSPLALCALAQLRSLADSPSQGSVRAARYLCRALASLAKSEGTLARLVHAGVVKHGLDAHAGEGSEEVRGDGATSKPSRKKARRASEPLAEATAAPAMGRGWQLCARLAAVATELAEGSEEDAAPAPATAAMASGRAEKRGVKRGEGMDSSSADVSSEATGQLGDTDLPAVIAWHHALLASSYDGAALAPHLLESSPLRHACADHLRVSAVRAAADEPTTSACDMLPLLAAWVRSQLATVAAGAPRTAVDEPTELASMARVWLPLLPQICIGHATGRSSAQGQGPPDARSDRDAASSRLASELARVLVRVGPPPTQQLLDIATRLHEMVSTAAPQLSSAARVRARGVARARPQPTDECARYAAAALCALLRAASDSARPSALQSAIEASVRLLLSPGVESTVGSAGSASAALCTALRALVEHGPTRRAFSSPPEQLLYVIRDLVRYASSAATIGVSIALLRAGAGASMVALLPTLQRQIFTESKVLQRLRRAPVSESSQLAMATAELLRLLHEIFAHSPTAIPAASLCLLLQAATCAPPRAHRLVSSLLELHARGGLALASFGNEEAATFASHVLYLSTSGSNAPGGAAAPAVAASAAGATCMSVTGGGATAIAGTDLPGAEMLEEDDDDEQLDDMDDEMSMLMMHEAVALQWLRPDDFHALAEQMPVETLLMAEVEPTLAEGCMLAEKVSATAATSLGARMEELVPSTRSAAAGGGCDTLGVLLTLQCFLRVAVIDARQWAERGAVGVCVMALSSASEHARLVGYDCLGLFMAALENGRSFAEQRQVGRILLSLRDAITEPNMRLPCCTSQFVAHGIKVMLRPIHPQYRALNAYIVGRPYLNLDEMPMFFDSFHGGGARSREERIWLLQLTARSLHFDTELAIISKRHALQVQPTQRPAACAPCTPTPRFL